MPLRTPSLVVALQYGADPAAPSQPRPSASVYLTVEDGTSTNVPVAIDMDGTLQLFVFPNYTYGGQCTARTKRGTRCNNVAGDGGQEVAYEQYRTGTRLVSAYGPLTGSVARRYLLQQCRVHTAEEFCPPKWKRFDSVCLHELTFNPSLDDLHSTGGAVPTPELLAAAVFADYNPEQRQRLVSLPTEQDHPAPGSTHPLRKARAGGPAPRQADTGCR